MLEILRGTLQQNLHPPFELCASTRGRLEWVERTAACGEHEKRKSNILDHLLIQKRNADSIYCSIRRREWRGQRETLRTGPERSTEQYEQSDA
jgi:hypothetical protein